MSDEGRLVAKRYRLAERIGRGGMGTVWRAADELLGRQVAIKQLHISPHLADDELATLYERTRREARSAARIAHPNVVVVHDVVDDRGVPCIVMEYVPSTTLADVVKRKGRIEVDEAARIGRGMIAALRAAHAAGVLHRDVKPGNVLLGTGGHPESGQGHFADAAAEAGRPSWSRRADEDGADGDGKRRGPLGDGRVVLTDFGIAVASGTSTLTKTGELVGSIDYVAPERVKGGKPGPASDLWALGATLFQALEGRPPFRKDTAFETAYAIAVDDLPPLRHAGVLAPLVEALLDKDPDARPSAETVEWTLRAAAAEAETELMRPSLLRDQTGRRTADTTPLAIAGPTARTGTPKADPQPSGPAQSGPATAAGGTSGASSGTAAGASSQSATGSAGSTGSAAAQAAAPGTASGAAPGTPARGETAPADGRTDSRTDARTDGRTAATHWSAAAPPAAQAPPQHGYQHQTQQPHQAQQPQQQARQQRQPQQQAHQAHRPQSQHQQHGQSQTHRQPQHSEAAGSGSDHSTTAITTVTPLRTPAKPRRGRATLWGAIAVAVAAAVAGAVVVYLVGNDDGDDGRPGTSQSDGPGPAKPTKGGPGKQTPRIKPSPVPAGYHLVREEDLGVAFPVPDGWTRKAGTGVQVDYVDPTGKVGIKINVLDFAADDHLKHFEEVESQWQEREPSLKRLRMQRTTFRGAEAAIWEFSFEGAARTFRGIDLGFGEEGKEEYAIYVSGPSDNWSEYRPIFDVIKDSFHTADDLKQTGGAAG